MINEVSITVKVKLLFFNNSSSQVGFKVLG